MEGRAGTELVGCRGRHSMGQGGLCWCCRSHEASLVHFGDPVKISRRTPRPWGLRCVSGSFQAVCPASPVDIIQFDPLNKRLPNARHPACPLLRHRPPPRTSLLPPLNPHLLPLFFPVSPSAPLEGRQDSPQPLRGDGLCNLPTGHGPKGRLRWRVGRRKRLPPSPLCWRPCCDSPGKGHPGVGTLLGRG